MTKNKYKLVTKTNSNTQDLLDIFIDPIDSCQQTPLYDESIDNNNDYIGPNAKIKKKSKIKSKKQYDSESEDTLEQVMKPIKNINSNKKINTKLILDEFESSASSLDKSKSKVRTNINEQIKKHQSIYSYSEDSTDVEQGLTSKKYIQPNEKNVVSSEKDKKTTQIDNYLEQMIKGTPLLKYTSNGDANMRIFGLSKDKEYIIWHPKNESMFDAIFGKSQDKRILYINRIDQIVSGQQSKNFGDLMKDYSSQSFSIIYEGGAKSIDLIAPTDIEYNIWFNGIKHLIKC
jgi:hypothetical protein